MQTLEAIVETTGAVRLLSDLKIPERRRALVTILDEAPNEVPNGSKKKRLIAAFKSAAEKGVFKGIEDPSEWQRGLRDEWN